MESGSSAVRIILGSLIPLLLAGCTDRFISLRTDPPGATVFLDGKEVGKTPCDLPFTWYGDRELVLELEGYGSRTEILEISSPWWQWPVLDFLTDVILPFRITDRRSFAFILPPLKPESVPVEAVRDRGEELRRKAREKP